MNPEGFYIGLISGTSMDGLDAALVRLSPDELELVGAETFPWPGNLAQSLRDLSKPGPNEIERFGRLDAELGEHMGECVLRLISNVGLRAAEINAIGSHGQTLRHRPDGPFPFSLQIGDPNRLAQIAGIPVVADFRRMDLACGGQGAPLVPPFHAWKFGHVFEERVVANIGGISNITIIPSGKRFDPVLGFDTGPGNTLMDAWIRRAKNKAFDEDGAWAASGHVVDDLLQILLADEYLSQVGPKSTGPEHFSVEWLDEKLGRLGHSPSDQDVQATLLELTASSLASAIQQASPECDRILVCGGGVHNRPLISRISELSKKVPVESTELHGLNPDHVEAVAFAWLAFQRIAGNTGNLPSVTGATRKVVLGALYLG